MGSIDGFVFFLFTLKEKGGTKLKKMLLHYFFVHLLNIITLEKDQIIICHEWEAKNKSESPTGKEPMASKIPARRSNQLSYEKLEVS